MRYSRCGRRIAAGALQCGDAQVRIGIVCPYSFDHPGGVQAHVIDLARVLIAQGHHVQVLGPGTRLEDLPDYVTIGGPAVPLSYNGSVARVAFGPQTFRTVRRFIDDGAFDVLHLHEPNAPSYSLAALMLARGPIVATYHASAVSSALLRAVRPILRPVLEKIQAGISVSEMSRRWQVEQLGGDPVLIPNGVDTRRFARAAQRAQKTQHEHAAREEDSVHVVFLGRLDEPRKGLATFLEALTMMASAPRVTVIGGGEHPDVAGVDFVGRVCEEDKSAILAAADIYVAPNTGGESFGIVLVEAMAARCAVVASDIEAFAAVCDARGEDPAGALFPVGDAARLAGLLDGLIADPHWRARLINAGVRRCRLYDWETVSAQILAVYETVDDGSGVHTR